MSSDSLVLTGEPVAPCGFDFTQCIPGREIVIARLRLSASQVKKMVYELDPTGRLRDAPLVIMADTFLLDDAPFNSMAIKIVARVFEIGAGPIPLVIPATLPPKPFFAEFIMGSIVNGPLKILPRNATPIQQSTESSFNPAHPVRFYCLNTPNPTQQGPTGFYTESDHERLGNHAGDTGRTPGFWGRLKALFPLACAQLYDPAERPEGLSRLRWIALFAHGLAAEQGVLAAEASHLHFQVSSLLLLASQGGARSVPVWSEAYLKSRIDDLLVVLNLYEEKIRTLELRRDIQLTVESLTAAWRDVAAADEKVLATASQLNDREIAAQTNQYYDLLWAYEMQAGALRLAWNKFNDGLQKTAILRQTAQVLEIAGAVAQMGAAAYGAGVPDAKAAENATRAATDGGEDVARRIGSLESIIFEAVKQKVIESLKKLKADFERVMKVGQAAAKALAKANEVDLARGMESRGRIDLPDFAEMATPDPEAGWNLFAIEVEVMLREFLDDRDGSGSVAGAKEYYIGLRALAEYGKALSLKSVALVRLQARKLELSEQRDAVRYAVARWEKLQADAKTAEEKFRLGQSLLEEAALNTRRSLFVVAEGYRAAYAYANLAETRLRLKFGMSSLELNEEFRSIKVDIGSFFATPRLAQAVTTEIFPIPVVKAGAAALPAGIHAVLHVREGGRPQLSWTTPITDPPFRKWLSAARRSGYFVKEAWFYLDGVTPDRDGVIGLRIATTGNYENGYGPGVPLRFTTQGFALDFAYQPTGGEDAPPFSPWRPTGRTQDNYMSPTPFTGWLATIERFGSIDGLKSIRMKLALLRLDAPEDGR